MSAQEKTELPCGQYSMGVPWYPQRKWWQSSRLFSQDVGLPPFLEPRDLRWLDVERLQRSLAACFWPGYIPAPLFVPYISAPMHHSEQMTSKEPYKWRVNLDVAHFSPSEISLSVSDGFLEVGGKHEERPDEHGFIARCFTRKYRLPAEINVINITSTLSVDGILTVEAPVPDPSVPAVIIIPIKVAGDKEEEEEADTDPDSCSAPDGPDTTCAEADGDESPLKLHGDQAHPGSAAAGLQQLKESREEGEETREKPAGSPLEPSHDEGAEGFQEARESQETQDQDTATLPERKETGVDEEIQEVESSEGLSQELEASGITQEHVK